MKNSIRKEIERKFIPNSIFEIAIYLETNAEYIETRYIKQGYILSRVHSFSEDTSKSVRIRSINNEKFYLTVKTGRDCWDNEECEVEITKDQFDSLWNTVERSLTKNRFIYKWKDKKIELDIFSSDILKGFVMMEIEFDSVEECAAFTYQNRPKEFGVDANPSMYFQNDHLAKIEKKEEWEHLIKWARKLYISNDGDK